MLRRIDQKPGPAVWACFHGPALANGLDHKSCWEENMGVNSVSVDHIHKTLWESVHPKPVMYKRKMTISRTKSFTLSEAQETDCSVHLCELSWIWSVKPFFYMLLVNSLPGSRTSILIWWQNQAMDSRILLDTATIRLNLVLQSVCGSNCWQQR